MNWGGISTPLLPQGVPGTGAEPMFFQSWPRWGLRLQTPFIGSVCCLPDIFRPGDAPAPLGAATEYKHRRHHTTGLTAEATRRGRTYTCTDVEERFKLDTHRVDLDRQHLNRQIFFLHHSLVLGSKLCQIVFSFFCQKKKTEILQQQDSRPIVQDSLPD